MKRINLEGVKTAEIADRIEKLNIVVNCASDNYAFISDEDAESLEKDMPFVDWYFESVEERCEYEDEDVKFVAEDNENIYIDLGTGLGVSIYEKEQWTLKEALIDAKKSNY